MAVSFPRISISVDNDRGEETQGEINILALGFGIHQAWIYSAMFGAENIFSTPLTLDVVTGASTSLVFLISIIVFGVSLVFAAITDQKLLKFYTAKRAIVLACALTAIGTFAIFAINLPGNLGFAATILAGVATGIGSALQILLWGTAFSRHASATIVMNTALAIVIAIAIYLFILHVIPAPFSGILTGFLPLIELPLLWRLTPVSYAVRHAIPIFNPLPVHKLPFSIRLALPTLLFGFALGALRSISTQHILPSSDPMIQLLTLFAGGAAMVLMLVTAFCIDERSHWDFLFRPLILLIAISLFFLPTLSMEDSVIEPLVLLTGYMCFEALMWVFFGEMSQEFRLSPIFVFGIGRGCLALGSLAGSLQVVDSYTFSSFTPFGEAGVAMLIMIVMVIAYVMMPRVRDIKRIVILPQPEKQTGIASLNNQVDIAVGKSHLTNGEGIESGAENSRASSESDKSLQQQQNTAGEQQVSATSEESAQSTATSKESSAETETTRKSGRFKAQCEAIANRYLLSRRETEVMFLLARGYNAAYIQDRLFISKSTTKTHIGHIYRKLDIHNQQELLLMVSETKNDAEHPSSRKK